MRDSELIPGRATPEGTERYAARFSELRGHFRRPDRLCLSSLALGTRNGDPGGVDDMLYRSAISELVQGGVNVFITKPLDVDQVIESVMRLGESGRKIRDAAHPAVA